MKRKKVYSLLTIASLVVCIICGFINNLVQTDFGKIEKKTINFESSSGYTISADILKPIEASKNNPRPAIVWAHGGNANKERSDNFQIEWARRGFTVVSFDLYGHGESEVLDDTKWLTNGRGLYDTVEYLTTIGYIDKEQIAVAGHSRGGNTIHESIQLDNEKDTPLIKSVLYIGRDAIYKDNETAAFGYFPGKTNTAQASKLDNGKYFNYYGSRDVGIIAGLYDDFSFKEKDDDGNLKPNPDILNFNNIKSFLNFGITPTQSTNPGIKGKWYTKNLNGKEAHRVIYTVNDHHNNSLYSSEAANDAIDFMVKSFNIDTNLSTSDHIYPIKNVSALIGLLAIFSFVVSFTLLLTNFYPFSVVASEQGATMRISKNNGKGKKWIICLITINTLFPIASALFLFHIKLDKIVHPFFNQSMPLFYGTWGAVNAFFIAFTTFLWYQFYAKKENIKLGDIDLKITPKKFFETFLFSVFIVFVTYYLVFLVKFMFNTDFRFNMYSIRPFEFERFLHVLKLLPLYLIAYLVPSIFINCLNYNTAFGKNPKINILVLTVLNIIAPVVLIVLGYGYFKLTGTNTFYGENNQISDWMVPPLFGLLISPLITRIIYEKTRNPYIGGIINGLLFGIITCVNSQIVFPS